MVAEIVVPKFIEITARVASQEQNDKKFQSVVDEMHKLPRPLDASQASDPWSAYLRGGTQQSVFVPSQVDVKGWVKDWSKRGEQSLSKIEAELYLQKVFTALCRVEAGGFNSGGVQGRGKVYEVKVCPKG